MENLMKTELVKIINSKRNKTLPEWTAPVDVKTEDTNHSIFDVTDTKDVGGSIIVAQGKGQATYFNRLKGNPYSLRFIAYEQFINQFNVLPNSKTGLCGDWTKGISRPDYMCYTTEEDAYFIIHELSEGDVSNKRSKARTQLVNCLLMMNYTDLNRVARQFELPEMSNIEYVHGCLSDCSAILGINDEVDTVDGAYDFMRKSFNPHYSSHPVGYDLRDADEVVFFGHSLGDNDYHYFQSFFKHQCEENLEPSEKRTITIFTYNETSRMEIMRTLHKMNHGRTSMLFQNNQLNIFCTYDEEFEMSDAFRDWYQYRVSEIKRVQTKEFFEDI